MKRQLVNIHFNCSSVCVFLWTNNSETNVTKFHVRCNRLFVRNFHKQNIYCVHVGSFMIASKRYANCNKCRRREWSQFSLSKQTSIILWVFWRKCNRTVRIIMMNDSVAQWNRNQFHWKYTNVQCNTTISTILQLPWMHWTTLRGVLYEANSFRCFW